MFKLKLENTSSDPECLVGSSLDSAPWRQPELGGSGGQVLGQVSIGRIIDMAISAEYEARPGPALTALNDREQSKWVWLATCQRSPNLTLMLNSLRPLNVTIGEHYCLQSTCW